MKEFESKNQLGVTIKLKRMFDLLIIFISLPVSLPVTLIVFVVVYISHGGPVIFKQPRLGYKEKSFNIYKFRTMQNLTDSNGELLPDDQRITKVGTILRSTSLDELPQLWNVITGHMSLVGPRPLYTFYLPFYTERERKRHFVRPGITGLAQVSGRNNLPWDERLEIDAEYVDNLTLWLDLKILWKTAVKVFRREDVVIIPATQQRRLDQVRSEDTR